jgi:cobalt-zinc-cadmium efflux system outer membrane protein
MRASHCGAMLVCAFVGAATAATADSGEAWRHVADESERRTGARLLRDAGEEQVGQVVDELLKGGVTRQEAVEIALSNNAELQVAFDELGIARGDLMEAGLYSNPDLDVVLRFPDSESGTEVEVELGFNIADLWLVPVRKGVASARGEQVTMAVVEAVLNTTADARRAHDDYIVARAMQEQAGQVLQAARAWRDQVRYRGEFGYTSDLDKSMADAFVAEREMEVAEVETEVAIADARLRRVLGLRQDDAAEVVGELPQAREHPPEPMELIEGALGERPDLRAARLGLLATRRETALVRRSVWDHVTVGPAYAREPEGTDLWGGVMQVEVPLFDRNQGRKARVAAQLRQREAGVRAMEALIREQVVTAAERLGLALAREQTIREKVIPARQQALDFSTRYYHEMQLNMLYVLEAREKLYEAQKEHIAALGQAAAAEVELEFVLGGRLPEE